MHCTPKIGFNQKKKKKKQEISVSTEVFGTECIIIECLAGSEQWLATTTRGSNFYLTLLFVEDNSVIVWEVKCKSGKCWSKVIYDFCRTWYVM